MEILTKNEILIMALYIPNFRNKNAKVISDIDIYTFIKERKLLHKKLTGTIPARLKNGVLSLKKWRDLNRYGDNMCNNNISFTHSEKNELKKISTDEQLKYFLVKKGINLRTCHLENNNRFEILTDNTSAFFDFDGTCLWKIDLNKGEENEH